MTSAPELPINITAPLLCTERLELWLPQPDDWLQVHAIVSEEQTGRYLGPPQMPDEGYARFLRSTGSWFLYGYGMFLLRLPGDDAVIGTCGVFHIWRGMGDDMDDVVEAGWILGENHVGKGYGREAMEAILAWFDEKFGLPMMCMIDPENSASQRLADKLGFTFAREADFTGEPVLLFSRQAAQQ